MEQWNRAYREAPEIFDAFTRAEDPDGLVVERLLAHADLQGRSVLEVGSGTGRYTQELAPHTGFYVAVERSPAMLRLALDRFRGTDAQPRVVCARAESLPLRSASIDQVVAGWVVVNLNARSRHASLSEIDRVLRGGRGSAAWLLENHWSGEFQELRQRRCEDDRERVRRLIDSAGFELVEVVKTELRFPTRAECERVLGYLCGEPVRQRLRREPKRTLTHNVVILRRPAPG